MKQKHNFRDTTLNDIHLTNCIINSIRQKPNLPDNAPYDNDVCVGVAKNQIYRLPSID